MYEGHIDTQDRTGVRPSINGQKHSIPAPFLSLPGVKDPRVRHYVPPVRLVWCAKQGVEGAENLLRPSDATVCRLTPGVGAALLLDFGQELHGGIRLDAPRNSNGKPVRLRVRFGESVSEAMGTPNNDHAIHDHEIDVPWMGHTEVGMTGFRFVRIDLLDQEATLELRAVEAVFLYRDLPYLGSFECNDERLNRIWQTGAYTVHLCLQDYVWDGIKRDRLVWIGDLHPEAMVAHAVFGGLDIVPATLDYERDRTPLPSDGEQRTAWMNGISSYSLWWIITQHDWYWRTGDRAYLEKQGEYLTGLLRCIIAFLEPDGSERLSGGRFLEWPTSDDAVATDAGLQALVVIALRAGAKLCAELGEVEAAETAAQAARHAGSVRRSVNGNKQASALTVLAGMEDAVVANEQVLAQDPYRGLSTFYGFYVLQARAKAGDWKGGLELIRHYWGGMLDAGATTFWEGFELDWWERDHATPIDALPEAGVPDIHADYGGWCYIGLRHSLCHGWAAGPTAWLSEQVLGVQPAAPGYSRVRIRPQLGDLDWVRGAVPTPYGLIEIECAARQDGTTEIVRLSLPSGVTLEVENSFVETK